MQSPGKPLTTAVDEHPQSPVQQRQLLGKSLHADSISMPLQVIEEGAWSEAVSSALSKLGVHVLDSQILPLHGLGGARQLIHTATGLGVVSAMSAAGAGDSSVEERFSAARLTSEERAQLCSFLLQVRYIHTTPFCQVAVRRCYGYC